MANNKKGKSTAQTKKKSSTKKSSTKATTNKSSAKKQSFYCYQTLQTKYQIIKKAPA